MIIKTITTNLGDVITETVAYLMMLIASVIMNEPE